MLEERNVVVTDSLILAASGRGRDLVEGFVDMSTTGVNFINIIQAAFFVQMSFGQLFSNYILTL